MGYDDVLLGTKGGPKHRFTLNGAITDSVSSLGSSEVGTVTYTEDLKLNTFDLALACDGSTRVNVNSDSGGGGINNTTLRRTISVWFQCTNTSPSGDGAIIWEEGGSTNWLNLYVLGGTLYGGAGESSTANGYVSSSITEGQTYHCVFNYDASGGASELYLDGVLVDSNSVSLGGSLDAHSDANAIGGLNGTTRNHLNNTGLGFFEGIISDVAIWHDSTGGYTSVLSSQEVVNIYRAGLGHQGTSRAVRTIVDEWGTFAGDFFNSIDTPVIKSAATRLTYDGDVLIGDRLTTGLTDSTAICIGKGSTVEGTAALCIGDQSYCADSSDGSVAIGASGYVRGATDCVAIGFSNQLFAGYTGATTTYYNGRTGTDTSDAERVDIGGPRWIAWTSPATFKVSQVGDLLYRSFSNGNVMTFSIYEGQGTGGTLLGSQVTPTLTNTGPASTASITFTFTPDVVVQAGEVYTLSFSSSDDTIVWYSTNIASVIINDRGDTKRIQFDLRGNAPGTITNSVSIGAYSEVTGSSAVNLGANGRANGDNAVSLLGDVTASGGVSIGSVRNVGGVSGTDSVAVGYGSLVSSPLSVALGANTSIAGASGRSLALGSYASIQASYSTAIGNNAQTVGASSMAIGPDASAGTGTISVGKQAGSTSSGEGCIFMGYSSGTSTTGSRNIIIGDSSGASLTSGSDNIIVAPVDGGQLLSTGSRNIAIGNLVAATLATGDNNVVIGMEADVDASTTSDAVVMGSYASGASQSVALGKNAQASGTGSMAVGLGSIASATDAVAVGRASEASGSKALSMGAEAYANASKAVAIGIKAKSTGTKSMAIGPYNGYYTEVSGADNISIGSRVGRRTKRLSNVALNGTASQSSTDFGGVASRAIDDNTDGVFANNSVTHTDDLADSYWRVDLDAAYVIRAVTLWNRTDCCWQRLSNFDLTVERKGVVIYRKYFREPVGYPDFTISDINVVGDAVQIQLQGFNLQGNGTLSLAEVQVWGDLEGDDFGVVTGSSNLFIGSNSGLAATTSSDCVVVGRDAGRDLTTATDAIAMGASAGNHRNLMLDTLEVSFTTSGLSFYVDPLNGYSYDQSSATIRSFTGQTIYATLNNAYSWDATRGGVRLTNNSGTSSSNTAHALTQSITFQTISFFYYQHSAPTTRYLFDARTSVPNSWIYSTNAGSFWSGATIYVNGGAGATFTSWSQIENVGVWQHITIVATSSGTSQCHLFSRFSGNEALDVTFGPLLIYDRAISQSENAQIYADLNQRVNNYNNGLVFYVEPSIGYCYPREGSVVHSLVGTNVSQSAEAVDFNKADPDYVEIAHYSDLNVSAVTVEMWIRPDTGSTTVESLFTKSNGGTLSLTVNNGSGSTNAFRWNPASTLAIDTPDNVFTAGEWIHLAVVYDPSQSLGKIYINGEDTNATVAAGSLSTAIPTNSNAIRLGIRLDGTIPYDGGMDEVRMWNYARSQKEIQKNIYNRVALETGLVLLMRFDGPGATYYNAFTRSSATNNGTTVITPDLNWNGPPSLTLYGDYSFDEATSGAEGIRLPNDTGMWETNQTNAITTQLTYQTVSFWYYQHSNSSGEFRYLIDGRSQVADSFIWSGGPGAFWSSGQLYINGGSSASFTWANIETIGSWQNITVVAPSAGTGSIVLFAANARTQSLDVTFGPILIWDRALSEHENTYVYNIMSARLQSLSHQSGALLLGAHTYISNALFQDDNGIAVGYQAATSNRSVAIGRSAMAQGDRQTIVGRDAAGSSGATDAIMMGSANKTGTGGYVDAVEAIAIGSGAQASGISIGMNAYTSDDGALAIGSADTIAERTEATGTDSFAMGYSASVTGANSVAMGWGASCSNYRSIAVGTSSNASGAVAIAIGRLSSSTATNAITIGTRSGTSASHGICIGYYSACRDNDSIIIGSYSSDSNVASQTDNVIIGRDCFVTARLNNTVIGRANSVAGYNGVVIGRGHVITGTQSSCIAIGYDCEVRANRRCGISIGQRCWKGATSNGANWAIGWYAGYGWTSGDLDFNVAIGYRAMGGGSGKAYDTDYCVAIGTNALRNTNGGEHNIAIGTNAARAVTTGDFNVLIGNASGYYTGGSAGGNTLLTGSNNTWVGALCNGRRTDEPGGTALGYKAATNRTRCIAAGIDCYAGFDIGTFVGTLQPGTGDRECIALGRFARAYGIASIAIGENVRAQADRCIAIGTNALASHYNSTCIGPSVTSNRNDCFRINMNTTTSSSSAFLRCSTSSVGPKIIYYNSSTALHKYDVEDVPDNYVGPRLDQLRVINYRQHLDDMESRVGVDTIGTLAHEVEAAFPNMVGYFDDFVTPGSVDYQSMQWYLIKECQELMVRIQALRDAAGLS